MVKEKESLRLALALGFYNDKRIRINKRFKSVKEKEAFRKLVETKKEELLVKELLRLGHIQFNLLGQMVSSNSNSIHYGLLVDSKEKLHIIEIDREGSNISLSSNVFNGKFNNKDYKLKDINKTLYNIEETGHILIKNTNLKEDITSKKESNGIKFIDYVEHAIDNLCKRKKVTLLIQHYYLIEIALHIQEITLIQKLH